MKKVFILIIAILCTLATLNSCEQNSVKRALKNATEEYGLEVKKVEVQKVGQGIYEGKIYLDRSILGLFRIIPVEVTKNTEGEWEIELNL